jgi:hypothetical protein
VVHAEREKKGSGCCFEGGGEEWDGHGVSSVSVAKGQES